MLWTELDHLSDEMHNLSSDYYSAGVSDTLSNNVKESKTFKVPILDLKKLEGVDLDIPLTPNPCENAVGSFQNDEEENEGEDGSDHTLEMMALLDEDDPTNNEYAEDEEFFDYTKQNEISLSKDNIEEDVVKTDDINLELHTQQTNF